MLTIPQPLLALLRTARRVTALTGAGISAESGVPTFREAQTGLWARYNPEELATPEAFQSNPKLVWDWYVWRRVLVGNAQPNAGHHALVELEKRLPTFTLITQNVDGLHRRAGNRQVLELHGNLFGTKCFAEENRVDNWPETEESPPRCPQCNAWLRPDVVWFGESLPVATLQQAETATTECELFFSIGTSALVYPAAGLPILARSQGAMVVEINPQPTPLSEQVDFLLQGPAGHVLPALIAQAFSD
ncbi:MAG: NAD-dependent deacylase [Candidatus Competibacteraceae bacterium]|jgi:NAD-dependent deacetylase|nr:NAD-dependent deacylase [Candidatus Competibacteraceae bacterium]